MSTKVLLIAVTIFGSLFLAPARSADAPLAMTIADSSKKDAGQLQIVNLTQNQIVSARLGGTTVVNLPEPIGPGATGRLDFSVLTKPCGMTEVVLTFDDDTDAGGVQDLCKLRKLTIHESTQSQ